MATDQTRQKAPSQGGSDYIDTPDTFDSQDEIAEQASRTLAFVSADLRRFLNLVEQLEDPALVCGLIYELRAVRAEVSSTKKNEPGVYQQVEQHLMGIMGEKKLNVPPYGEFTARRSMSRTEWRHRPTDDRPGLVDVIVARAADDWSGEPPAVFGRFVADELAACIGFGPGKVTGLRARGIDPSEFCTEEPKAWSLELPKKVDPDDLGLMGEEDRAA